VIESIIIEQRNIANRLAYLIQMQSFKDFFKKLTLNEQRDLEAAAKSLDESFIRKFFLVRTTGFLEEKTVKELRNIASQFAIERYSQMNKEELLIAITQARGTT
jgi:hypothetical protein